MVACPYDSRGQEGALRGREIVNTPWALSVPYGSMSGMRGTKPDMEPPELPEYAERVLDVAEQVPPGRVLTYGDVAEWLRDEDECEDGGGHGNGRGPGGPRQVGRALALYGGAVPWWRIVRADGVLLPGHELEAMDRYRAEGTPLRDAPRTAEGHRPRLDMRRARWGGAAD